jgi:hypothetical protein
VQQSSPPDAPRAEEPAAPASGPGPLTWKGVARFLAVATVISLFFSLLTPFGMGVLPLLTRTISIVVYGWCGVLLGLLCTRVAARLGLWRRGLVAAGLATGLLMAPAMSVIVWLGAAVTNEAPPPPAAIPEIVWQTGLVCVAMSFLAVALSRRARPSSAAPVKFLERLPPRLHGGELWAVEAEDHYLRLHTSKGQDLILMRLADAIAELAGIEGAQVHRSWWVARGAIAEARRGDGRATLTLKDGSEVPVSRTYARALRERRWI